MPVPRLPCPCGRWTVRWRLIKNDLMSLLRGSEVPFVRGHRDGQAFGLRLSIPFRHKET